MPEYESPADKLAQISAERARLANLAFTIPPSPAAGMTRVMWFDNSDETNTPMPVDVPEDVAARITAISESAQTGHSVLAIREQREAARQIRKIMQPYIDAKYPTLPRQSARLSWWRRALRKCGLHV